jgi:hypothetical protein
MRPVAVEKMLLEFEVRLTVKPNVWLEMSTLYRGLRALRCGCGVGNGTSYLWRWGSLNCMDVGKEGYNDQLMAFEWISVHVQRNSWGQRKREGLVTAH